MKTRAAILVEQKKPLEIWELEVPPLKKGQVLVKIAYSGVCHTQLNEWKGSKGADPYLPHTLGHEGSGEVLEIGEGVTKVQAGDSVVLSWMKGKGLEAGGTTYGKVNSGPISTFMEIAIVSENRVIPIPKGLSMKKAALLGCAIPTGAGVVFNDMGVKKGQSIAVFGVGGVGLSAILAAKSAGAEKIVAIDVHEEKLKRAQEFGATHLVNASTENVEESVKEMDYALESAGRKGVMEMAFKSVKAGGGHCVLAGNLPKGETIAIDPFDLIRGKKIFGTWGGASKIDEDVKRYVETFMGGDTLDKMISDVVKLDQINELMSALDKGTVARGLIEL